MKVKQIVETQFHDVFLGWNNISFTDVNDNAVKVEINDDQILALSDKLLEKATEIRKEREPVEEHELDE
tara:strand:+ start:296 stop:502 length:207 start_codon:yes stop_codon:yes gene_type:complete